MHRPYPFLSMAALLLGLPFPVLASSAAAVPCASLSKLALPGATVVRAEEVGAGAFLSPTPEEAGASKDLPAFCRVTVRATPSADSDIKIEVWLPVSGWNGKFRAQGNGGFAGEIDYSLLGLSVAQGYASGATDTGHTGKSTDAAWALGHPEKIIDFGYRGVHEMTAKAKIVIDAYYGRPAEHNYFVSCSDGGREALMEAQRFPADYDGILAGAPAYAWTNLVTRGAAKSLALIRIPDSYIRAAQIPAIAAGVNAACDAADGVTDGILNDPRQCRFEPKTLQCKPGQAADSCLTGAQVQTLTALYAATLDSHGHQVYPATPPGGEDGPGGWAQWVVGAAPDKSLGYAFSTGYFANMVYGDPHWDIKTFHIDAGLQAALATTGAALNATDPNLKPFAARGGKLILYHGWNDPAISPLSTLAYYQQVQKANAHADTFTRLFMVPGMQHCYGGPGPSSFGQFGWRPGTGPDDAQHVLYLGLEQWVEQGAAPEVVIASRIESDGKTTPKVTMTRPLCAYPKQAEYKGAGDSKDANSFSCTAAAK